MNESLPASPPNACLRLGAAQYAAAGIVALGLADLALQLTWTADWERMQYAGAAVFALGLGYLTVTALCAWQWAGRLRNGRRISPRELTLAGTGHASVLAVAAWIFILGDESQTFYAGLDRLVATLGVASFLVLILLFGVRAWQRIGSSAAGARAVVPLLVVAAGASEVVALVWLENVSL